MVSLQSELTIPSRPIRAGVWLIPVGGVVPAAVFTYFMTTPTDTKGAAEASTSFAGLASGFLYLLALVGLILGLVSLYGSLAGGPSGGPALAGLVLSVVSIGLLLAAFGAAILAGAVASDVYLSGDTGASDVIDKLSGGTFGRAILMTFIAASVIGLAGASAFGVAIWRSGTLPKWSAILYALGFVLLVASVPIVTHVGGILLAIGGVWIARTIGREGEGAVRRSSVASMT